MMIKTLAAGTIALTLAGAGFALAQQTPRRDAPGFRPSAEDAAAFTDARIAGLKAGLKLTPDQEKNWPAVETAIRDLAKQRADRMKERSDRMNTRREARRGGDGAAAGNGRDTIARLRQGADAMNARADSLKKLADASEPLYKSLDDSQKRRFAMLLRMGGRSGGHFHHHWQRRAELAR
jgi:zinc resistance-associated protein